MYATAATQEERRTHWALKPLEKACLQVTSPVSLKIQANG